MEITRMPVVIGGQPGGYAKGAKVTGASGIVFMSGRCGRDDVTGKNVEGAGEQTKIALEKIKQGLVELGSSLENILHINTYRKGNFPNGMGSDPKSAEIANAMQEFWKENCPQFMKGNSPPAMTGVGVTALGQAEWLIEIQVVAAVP